ncbi:MAG: undecaprenyl-diphosphate phosphatase [Chloroflexota bacterium]
MDWARFALLGLVQGATEFIPVSSSGHLVLVPWLMGWKHPGLLFDTIVHWGTLAGVLACLWRDVRSLLQAWLQSISRRRVTTLEERLAWFIILGTIPAALMGCLWGDFFEELFDSPPKVAALLLATGAVLVLGETQGSKSRGLERLSVLDVVLIGIAQGIAIAPGISRSGITMATGLFRGIRREEAARYSFLLSIPIILGAGLQQISRAPLGSLEQGWPPLALGFLCAGISGFISVQILLSFLRRHRLYVFAAYCWLMGGISLLLAMAGWK